MSYTRERFNNLDTEQAFQDEIIRVAGLLGFQHYHTWNSKRSPAGWPDLVLIKFPRLLFIECKTRTGLLNAAQRWWLQELGKFAAVINRLHIATSEANGEELKIIVDCWRAPGDWGQIAAALGVPSQAIRDTGGVQTPAIPATGSESHPGGSEGHSRGASSEAQATLAEAFRRVALPRRLPELPPMPLHYEGKPAGALRRRVARTLTPKQKGGT